MKTTLSWKEGLEFETSAAGNSITLDAKAPLGKSRGMTPKELIGAAISGCTAMDVVAYLKKYRQPMEAFTMEVELTAATGVTPAVFIDAEVLYHLSGNIDPKILMESVQQSQTQYCSVSAMLSKAFPIRYHVILNDKEIGSGQADFSGIKTE
jgi:putative redox protein